MQQREGANHTVSPSSSLIHHPSSLLGSSAPPPQVNLVIGPMGLLLSGYVSNPGGNLTVAPPSQLNNAEVAAGQLVEYLQGRMVSRQ
jgi:hypothetical protein